VDHLSYDILASLSLFGALAAALAFYVALGSAETADLVEARVDREAPLPLLGRTPMYAVYRPLVPFARGLAAVGISANALSLASAAVALPAAWAFATGHFGVAALLAAVASLMDGLDGLVARLSGTASRLGKVLDTTIDRYVDALFVGGIALYVRSDAFLLAVALAALVGSFMVSYASSVERECKVDPGPAPLRRSHRVAILIVAAGAAPLVRRVFETSPVRVELVPVFLAIGTIALIGNVSAVGRLIRAGSGGDAPSTPPPSEPAVTRAEEVAVGANEGK
jgi:phosphatidylglycerophosphate synthase